MSDRLKYDCQHQYVCDRVQQCPDVAPGLLPNRVDISRMRRAETMRMCVTKYMQFSLCLPTHWHQGVVGDRTDLLA